MTRYPDKGSSSVAASWHLFKGHLAGVRVRFAIFFSKMSRSFAFGHFGQFIKDFMMAKVCPLNKLIEFIYSFPMDQED